jgi:hypothetical protein
MLRILRLGYCFEPTMYRQVVVTPARIKSAFDVWFLQFLSFSRPPFFLQRLRRPYDIVALIQRITFSFWNFTWAGTAGC